MWPFKKDEAEAVGAVIVQEVLIKEQEKAKKPETVCPPFGERIGELTRFGKTWLNLAEVSVIEFEPPDGCGCEVMFKNNDSQWHVRDEDALAIKTYLENFDSIRKQIDS